MPVSSLSLFITLGIAVGVLILAFIMNCRRIKELTERVTQTEFKLITCPDAFEVSRLSKRTMQESEREVRHRLGLMEQAYAQHQSHIDDIAEYLRISAGGDPDAPNATHTPDEGDDEEFFPDDAVEETPAPKEKGGPPNSPASSPDRIRAQVAALLAPRFVELPPEPVVETPAQKAFDLPPSGSLTTLD